MINIPEKTEDELKVMAYDLMLQLETTRQNLQIVNTELAGRVKKEPVKIVPMTDKAS